jgi:polysaccharide export outer membrane protein
MAQQAARQQAGPQPAAPAPNNPMPAAQDTMQQQLMLHAAQASRSNYKDYRVGPEDLLFIDVYGQEGLRRELRVNGQGLISMPLVGVVKVAGLSTQEIENRLREAYGSQYLRNPQITVEVKEFHHQRVAVTGAVSKPGFYDIIGPRTIMEVLSMAGGLSSKPGPEAGDAIHLIRNQKTSDQGQTGQPVAGRYYSPQTRTLVINLHRLVNGQAPELNVMVENGDVISVPFAGTAYVLGGVKKPGSVTVNNNLTVSQAVAMAQGVDPMYGTSKIVIMRFDDQGMPIRVEGDLKEITDGKAPDLPVKDNDAIVVKEGQLKTKLYVWRQILPIPSGGYAIPTR